MLQYGNAHSIVHNHLDSNTDAQRLRLSASVAECLLRLEACARVVINVNNTVPNEFRLTYGDIFNGIDSVLFPCNYFQLKPLLLQEL